MIRLRLSPDREPECSGLIPGEELRVFAPGGRVWLIHRHGSSCHAHDISSAPAHDSTKGENE